MSRIIKFRAWNKKNQTMYLSPDEIEHLGSWFDAHLPGAIADKYNIFIMQFTGLLDKNGKEIYEGDIVSQPAYNGSEYLLVGVVEFDQGGFCLKCINSNKSLVIGSHYAFQLYRDETQLKKGKIIGNIFENDIKHLLEAQG